MARDVGAGEANEIATNGGSSTAAVGNTIRSGTGVSADTGAAVGSCPGAGLDAYGEITSASAAGADVDGEVSFAVDKTAGNGEIRSAGLSDSAWTEGVVVGDSRAGEATPAVARSGDSV